MKRVFQFSVVLLILSFAAISNSEVLYFDNITTDPYYDYIPSGYGGFTWGKMNAETNSYMDIQVTPQSWVNSETYRNSLSFPSEKYAAFNYDGMKEILIKSAPGSTFTFNGAWFASWGSEDQFNDISAYTISIIGFNEDDTEAGHMEPFNLSAEGFTWVNADFLNINKLVIRASGNPEDEMDNRYWLMDNFTYDEAVATPEPLTATLFGISLLGLAGLRRRLS